MVSKRNPPDLSGEVVLIPKSAIPPIKPVKPAPPPPPPKETTEISATRYEREVRPKKDLSEKQKANLDKLIEANKKRALERRAVVKEIPESIPEDSVLVKVKPKRMYNRKPKEEPKNEIVVPETETETDDTDYEPEPVLRERRKPTKPKKPVKAKPAKPVKKTYRYDTETTSQDESTDSDSDDDKVQKYESKVEKRLEAVRSIDQRLQQMKNPYAGKLSIF
jgi:hypothetical protein